jgi:hypothetical protein
MDSAPYPCPQILEFYCTFHLKVKLKVGVMPESVPFSQTEVRELFRMAHQWGQYREPTGLIINLIEYIQYLLHGQVSQSNKEPLKKPEGQSSTCRARG